LRQNVVAVERICRVVPDSLKFLDVRNVSSSARTLRNHKVHGAVGGNASPRWRILADHQARRNRGMVLLGYGSNRETNSCDSVLCRRLRLANDIGNRDLTV